MPWRCPACQEQILHSPLEELPRPGAVYRCHICRLELALDPETSQLAVTPIVDETDGRAKPLDFAK